MVTNGINMSKKQSTYTWFIPSDRIVHTVRSKLDKHLITVTKNGKTEIMTYAEYYNANKHNYIRPELLGDLCK